MTGEGNKQEDLVISKLLRLEPGSYKSIFPHLSAADSTQQPRKNSYER